MRRLLQILGGVALLALFFSAMASAYIVWLIAGTRL